MSLVFFLFILCLVNCFRINMTDNRNSGNNNSQPYVVGILSPSTTLYIDQAADNGNIVPPTDINLERRNTNSFQITSVTVQGSRKNDDMAYDSADDLDESHTEDLSSDILDSSKADYEGYHSEDNLCDDLASPCGQIIFTQLPSGMVDRNMNLSIGVTPTFASIGPVAGGVTMMTSKSESPISAQVPIMNPLPNNWQRRFKVVKIISSEPFKRGRWLCMDFKDPPADMEAESKPENNGQNTPPTIQITNCDSDEHHDGFLNVGNFAQVYEIPINQTYRGNFIMGEQEHMYGIILPQNEYLQPVTLVQDLSLQTTNADRNFNNLVNHQSILVQGDPFSNALPFSHPMQQQNVGMVVNNGIPSQSPPSTQVADIYTSASNSVLNTIGANGNTITCDPVVPPIRSRNNSESNRIQLNLNHVPPALKQAGAGVEESESFLPPCIPSFVPDTSVSYCSPVLPANGVPGPITGVPVTFPPTSYIANCATVAANTMVAPPVFTEVNSFLPQCVLPLVSDTNVSYCNPVLPINGVPMMYPASNHIADTATVTVNTTVSASVVAEAESSQTAPEKLPSSEVGQEVDPSAGSAVPTGANTVAIDNKIEQAMDLVKSHLMFAVREEVEVLREKITELLDRISQLEHENDILRANASAETLKQLNNQKSASGGNTGKSPPVTAIQPPST